MNAKKSMLPSVNFSFEKQKQCMLLQAQNILRSNEAVVFAL